VSCTESTIEPSPAAALGALVSLENLPSPPSIAMEIIRLTRDENSSATDLAAVLAQDPVLAIRILQIANSPVYALSREVASIERATALLGLKAVKMMALSFSLVSDMDGAGGSLSTGTYWYHSLLNAVSARRWAEAIAPVLAEEAFMVGLLSHLGRLVLSQVKDSEFADLLQSHGGAWPSHAAETAAFGYSSADLTVVLLEEWGLPALVVEGAASMYLCRPADPGLNGAVELAEVLAKVVATEGVLGLPGDAEALVRFEAVATSAGIGADMLDDFVADLDERLKDIAEMLNVSLPGGVSPQQLLDEARNKLVSVSLETVQSLQTAEVQAEKLRASNEWLEGQAFEDRLTGIPNRAAFDDHLARVVAGALRSEDGSVGMLIFDIDRFKAFNDTYGHQAGDDVLREVAQSIQAATRSDELFARYGGEEFALIAVDCTGPDLFVTGERLRGVVEELRIQTSAGELSVTISGGAAVIKPVDDPDAGQGLIKSADEALYEAKGAGRNQIRVAS